MLARNGAKLLVKLQKRRHPSSRVQAVRIYTDPLKEYRSSVVCMYYYGFRCWSRIFSLKDKKFDEDDYDNDDEEDHGDEDGEKMTTSCRRRLSSFRKP